MSTFATDALQALRGLRRNLPLFFAIVGIIALTVGANGLIFGLVRGVLLSPLPYPDSGKLVMVWEENPGKGYLHNTVSPSNFKDWHREARSFSALAAWRQQEKVLSSLDKPERLTGAMVTKDFFAALGVKPLLGRSFSADEERERAPLALISEGLWRRRFGAAPEILGRNILLDDRPYSVIGVMPEDFDRPIQSLFKKGDFWLPLDVPPRSETRGSRFLRVVGRVAGSPEASRAELANISRQLAQRYPENAGWETSVIPLDRELLQNVRPVLQILWVAAFVVLLVGCTNLANVLLARAAGREHEIALRLSLGATRWRLFALFAAEILVLVLPGSLLGALLAWAGGRFLTYNYLQFLPRLEEIDFGAPVLRFTLFLTVVIVLFTAALVMAQALRLDLGRQLIQMGHRAGASRGTKLTRDLLAVLQIALTFPLLVVTLLLMKSVQQLEQVDLGIDPGNVLAGQVTLSESRYGDPGAQSAFFQGLLDRLQEAPEIAARSAVSDLPLSPWDTGVEFRHIGSETRADGKPPSAQLRVVAGDYFLTMGVRQMRGRDFDERDRKDAETVFVVSQELARRFFADRDPIGERLSIDRSGEPLEGRVVGVVGDVRHGGPADELRPTIYASYLQLPTRRMTIIVRSKARTEAVAATFRSEIRRLDRNLPEFELISMESLYDEAVATPRLRALVLGVLGGLALALATLGIYGVVSYSTAIRRQEIGVRMALGAKRAEILLMILKQGAILCLWGIGGGAVLAIAAGRLLASNLFGVSAMDPVTFTVIAALLISIGVIASLKPASDAIHLPPTLVLKGE